MVEPPNLALEHSADGPRDADVRGRLRVECLQIAEQRGRSVRQPFLREKLERQRIAVARLKDARHRHVRDPSPCLRDPRSDQPLGRLARQRLELHRLERLDLAVGHQRARTGDHPQLVGSRRENHQESRTRQLAGHDVENRDRGVVGSVDVVHHEDQRTFFRSGLDRLEEAVSETQRNDLGRPFHGLRHAGEHGENLRRDARQFAQRLRVRSSNRALQRQLLHQLGEHGEGQFALRIVCLGTRNRRPLHLTGRHERVRESGLSHARIAEQGDDVGLAPSHPEPRVIQTRELALASDERFGLEAPLVTLRHLPGFGWPRCRASAFPKQARDANQVGARLRAQLLRQPRLKPPVHLERIAPIAHPRPRFHHASHAVLGQGIELEQQLRVPLHGFEVADAAPVIHLLHEGIPDSRHQLRPPLVLPLLKLDRSRHLESIKELTTDPSLGGIEPGQVHLNRSRHEREGGPLYDEMVPPNSLL